MYVLVNVVGYSDSLTLTRLVRDCSTYNIGGVDNYYETREGAAALVSYLLTDHLSCGKSGAYKLVFTNYSYFFNRSKLYELLKSMSFAEHITAINNYDEYIEEGPSEGFQLRILEIDKRYDQVSEVFKSYIKDLTLPQHIKRTHPEEDPPTTFIVKHAIQSYDEECEGDW